MNRSQARSIAESFLSRIQPDAQAECPEEFAIIDDATREFELGYVFCYNTKRFLESGDFDFALAGNGPLLVKRDGQIVELPANQSIEASMRGLL